MRLAPLVLAAVLGMASWPWLASASEGAPQQVDIELTATSKRIVPTRVFAPAGGCQRCTLLIFSHGAFSTYDRYDRLLLEWAGAGFVVAAPLHVDSEEHPERDLYTRDVALATRIEDYLVLRDTLSSAGHLEKLGVSLSGDTVAAGHSFGALVAQTAGGASLPMLSADTMDALAAKPPETVIAISPPPVMSGYAEPDDWADVSVPMLVITGTTDVLPPFVTDWRLHLASYSAAPKALAYALIFDSADHYFNGAFGRPTQEGDRMAATLKQLNQSIIGFIHAAQEGKSPTEAAWWQSLPGTVVKLARGEAVAN